MVNDHWSLFFYISHYRPLLIHHNIIISSINQQVKKFLVYNNIHCITYLYTINFIQVTYSGISDLRIKLLVIISLKTRLNFKNSKS